MNSVAYNPLVTTNAGGSFNVETTGYIQGQALDQPAIRNTLAGGVLLATAALPMWGGVGIYELIPGAANTPNGVLGGTVDRATSLTGSTALTGFSVFDQAHAMINSPSSPVPVAPGGGQVNFYRLGSGARIAVACDPSLVSLDGTIINGPVSWDFTAQRLIPYSATYPTGTITGAVWAANQIDYTVSTDLTADINAGDDINVAGVVSTGATTDGYNGNYTVVSISATHIIVTAVRAASPGTYDSGGTVVAGGGALACKVLDVQIGNSMIVDYDAVTGVATWDRSGSTAIILI
jgi:hypothetical protein